MQMNTFRQIWEVFAVILKDTFVPLPSSVLGLPLHGCRPTDLGGCSVSFSLFSLCSSERMVSAAPTLSPLLATPLKSPSLH